MFFGVSGYEVETLLAEGADTFDDKNMMLHPDLSLPIDMKLSQTSLEDEQMLEIAQVDEIQIKAIRNANPLLESVPPSTILNTDTGLTKLVGVAKTSLEFEHGLMILGDFCVEINSIDPGRMKGWELTGFNIKFETYPPE
jgi:hypothetical protein